MELARLQTGRVKLCQSLVPAHTPYGRGGVRAHLLPGAALIAHDLVGTFMFHAVLPVVCCMARCTLLAQELDAESHMAVGRFRDRTWQCSGTPGLPSGACKRASEGVCARVR